MTETSEAIKARIADMRAQAEAVIEQLATAAVEIRETVEDRLREVTETLNDIVADLDRAEGENNQNP